MAQLADWVTWKRISDSDFHDDKSFFGPNGLSSVNPKDIIQGYIGDCWGMAAISALAERKGRVDDFFVSDAISPQGIYAAKMYTLGVPFTVIVDDYLPMDGNTPIFGGIATDNSVWGAVTEKKFAKRYGNYEHLVGGWMQMAVSALNGSPFKTFEHSELSEQALWDLLKSHDIKHDIMTAGSHFCGSHDETNENGVACSHAYTTLGCHEFDTTNGTVKLVKVRNPWGQEQYAGPWSDDSDLWTPEYRREVHDALGDALEASNEGIFFMDVASYKSNF